MSLRKPRAKSGPPPAEPNPIKPLIATKRRPVTHVSPEIAEKVLSLHLQNQPRHRIATKLKVPESQISRLLDEVLLPDLRRQSIRDLQEEVAKVDLLEKIAWERLGDSETSSVKQVLADLESQVGEGKLDRATIKLLHSHDLLQGVPDKSWVDVIEWCVTTRCRLRGFLAATPQGGGKLSETLPIAAHQQTVFNISVHPAALAQLQDSVIALQSNG